MSLVCTWHAAHDFPRRGMHPFGGACRCEPLDPLVHSVRWVQQYPFLAAAEARIWRDDFDPVAAWVKNSKDNVQDVKP